MLFDAAPKERRESFLIERWSLEEFLKQLA